MEHPSPKIPAGVLRLCAESNRPDAKATSQLLDRVKLFLPKIEKANQDLQPAVVVDPLTATTDSTTIDGFELEKCGGGDSDSSCSTSSTDSDDDGASTSGDDDELKKQKRKTKRTVDSSKVVANGDCKPKIVMDLALFACDDDEVPDSANSDTTTDVPSDAEVVRKPKKLVEETDQS